MKSNQERLPGLYSVGFRRTTRKGKEKIVEVSSEIARWVVTEEGSYWELFGIGEAFSDGEFDSIGDRYNFEDIYITDKQASNAKAN